MSTSLSTHSSNANLSEELIHVRALCEKLYYGFLQQDPFCDTRICTTTTTLYAHAAVLAAASPQMALLIKPIRQKTYKVKFELNLKSMDCTHGIAKCLLRYCYLGILDTTHVSSQARLAQVALNMGLEAALKCTDKKNVKKLQEVYRSDEPNMSSIESEIIKPTHMYSSQKVKEDKQFKKESSHIETFKLSEHSENDFTQFTVILQDPEEHSLSTDYSCNETNQEQNRLNSDYLTFSAPAKEEFKDTEFHRELRYIGFADDLCTSSDDKVEICDYEAFHSTKLQEFNSIEVRNDNKCATSIGVDYCDESKDFDKEISSLQDTDDVPESLLLTDSDNIANSILITTNSTVHESVVNSDDKDIPESVLMTDAIDVIMGQIAHLKDQAPRDNSRLNEEYREKPTTLIAKQPSGPIDEQHTQPIATQANNRLIADQPARPIAEGQTEPITRKPSRPIAEQPTQRINNEQNQPIIKEPTRPIAESLIPYIVEQPTGIPPAKALDAKNSLDMTHNLELEEDKVISILPTSKEIGTSPSIVHTEPQSRPRRKRKQVFPEDGNEKPSSPKQSKLPDDIPRPVNTSTFAEENEAGEIDDMEAADTRDYDDEVSSEPAVVPNNRTNKGKIIGVTCYKCHVTFPTKDARANHLKSENLVKCSTTNCKFTCCSELAVIKHIHTCHEIDLDTLAKKFAKTFESLTCQINECKYKSLDKRELKKHRKSHEDSKGFYCSICDKWLQHLHTYKAHMAAMHAGDNGQSTSFTCDKCGKNFVNKTNLTTHVKRVHLGTMPSMMCCELCGFEANNKRKLLTHIWTDHDIPPPDRYPRFQCKQCGYKTLQKGGFEVHMRRHKGERTHICDLCGRAFITEHELFAHREFHKDASDRKFKCDECAFSAVTLHKLQQHIETRHATDTPKPFVCGVCDYRTNIKGNLTLHLRKTHRMEVHTRQPIQAKSKRLKTTRGEVYAPKNPKTNNKTTSKNGSLQKSTPVTAAATVDSTPKTKLKIRGLHNQAVKPQIVFAIAQNTGSLSTHGASDASGPIQGQMYALVMPQGSNVQQQTEGLYIDNMANSVVTNGDEVSL